MKKLYICCTYYHLLISIIKSLKSDDECDLFLSTTWHDFTLIHDILLIKKLKESNIFSNVIVDNNFIQDREKIVNSDIKEIKKFFIMKKIKKFFPLKLTDYDEIYLFSYNNPTGRIVNKSKIYHNLLEDGMDCYKNNQVIIKSKLTFKNFIKKFVLKLDDLGESKYTKSIEVNDKNGIKIKNKKIIEVSKKKMFEELSKKEKNLIFSLFISNDKWKMLNDTSLILTQPFYEDDILNSKSKQINIYKDIINEFCINDNVVIKPHPRDHTDYKSIISSSNIIDDIFPLEILNFVNIKFNKVITVSSTSINLIYNCNKKIVLGWDWLDKKVKEYEGK